MAHPTPSAHGAPPPEMPRRNFLAWVIDIVGGLFALALAAPIAAYVLDPRNRAAAASAFKPVARLDELTTGVPREFVIREQRRDAWTLHPNEIVGRVFLIRQPDEGGLPKVTAF